MKVQADEMVDQITRTTFISRVQSARPQATVANACRLLGVANLKEQPQRNGRIKLTPTMSFMSEDSTSETSDSHWNDQNYPQETKIYDKKGIPIQPSNSKKVVSLIFEDPMKKFIQIKAKQRELDQIKQVNSNFRRTRSMTNHGFKIAHWIKAERDQKVTCKIPRKVELAHINESYLAISQFKCKGNSTTLNRNKGLINFASRVSQKHAIIKAFSLR